MTARPTHVGLRAVAVLALALVAGACGAPADHGREAPQTASAAVDCAGPPYAHGRGNDDSGPEDVQDSAGAALDDWREQEGSVLPDVDVEEVARHGDDALFTWSSGGTVLAAFVVEDGTAGLDGHRGWGVTSYAVCDPAEWSTEQSEQLGYGIWTDSDGDRVPTNRIHSVAGPEHCGWQGMTFLFLGEDGADGEFYGTPDPELRTLLASTYAAHAELPADARDTGYRRDGRQLWLAADGSAAYLVTGDGDAERWPAPRQEPIRCA